MRRSGRAALWATLAAAVGFAVGVWAALLYLLIRWPVHTLTTFVVVVVVLMAVANLREHHTRHRARRRVSLAKLREVLGDDDYQELLDPARPVGRNRVNG